jgi:hypothetical protein
MYQSESRRPRQRLAAINCAELLINVSPMILNCPWADEKAPGDLQVGIAIGQQLEDFQLARGQV